MEIDFAKLRAPFPPEKISWRVGSTNKDKNKGMALAYIDARDVMERLDEVCGPRNWQCRYPHANGKTVCDIGIKVEGEWVWKADGAGDTDFEAEKGAMSDALKRAAVRWGIGRYLYDIDASWVAIEAVGKSYKIADSALPNLRKLLTAPIDYAKWAVDAEKQIKEIKTLEYLKDWWTENGEIIVKKLDEQQREKLTKAKDAQKKKLTPIPDATQDKSSVRRADELLGA